MTEADVMLALRARFAPPAWALLPQVRNGTGYGRSQVRTADAIAMSLWPSRGLELHGFEVKVSRGDWLRELAAPEKAEEIAAYCHCWWLVVGDASIVQPGELPAAWGLLVPKGKKLIAKVEAPAKEAKPLDLLLLAALMRRMHEIASERIDSSEVQTEADKRVEREKAAWLGEERSKRLVIERDHDVLKEHVRQFEERAGIRIGGYEGRRVGDAVKLILAGADLDRQRVRLEHTAEHLESIASDLRAAIAKSEVP